MFKHIQDETEVPQEAKEVPVKSLQDAKTYCDFYGPQDAYYLDDDPPLLWVVPKGDCGQNKSLSY